MEPDQRLSIAERSRQRERRAEVKVYRGVAEENAAETLRRARMSVQQRFDEFAAIRSRIYGDALNEPMQKVATWEYVRWENK